MRNMGNYLNQLPDCQEASSALTKTLSLTKLESHASEPSSQLGLNLGLPFGTNTCVLLHTKRLEKH